MDLPRPLTTATHGARTLVRTPRARWAARAVLAAVAVFAAARPATAAALVGSSATAAGDALTWWKAAILGVVEGVTEYLPISSTGHLLIASRLLGLPDAKGSAGLDAVNTYAVAIQFGAILAVLGLFWKRFVEMLQGLVGRNPEGRKLLINLVIAFVPSAILGVALDKKLEDALFGPWPVVVAWIVGGIVILVFDRYRNGELLRRGQGTVVDMTTRQALWIGVAQCIALWPGTSRSLATILAALLVGLSMSAAVEFSFLLGFATLSAATGYKLLKDGGNLVDQFGVVDPLIGAFFAFVSAVLAIRWLVTYLQRHDLTIFAWYRFAVAALTIGLIASSVI